MANPSTKDVTELLRAWSGGDREVVRPELSPNGSQFAMRLPRRTQDDVVVVGRDGSNWRDITDDKFFDRYPRFSPDGRRIAFTSDRGGRYEIWMIDTDGTNLRQVTFDTRGDTSFPVWSPDGRRLVFGHEGKVFVFDTSTKKMRELFVTRHEQIRSVDVSADGRLLYYTVPSSESDIWLLDLD